MSRHDLDRARRRADAVTAFTLERYQTLPSRLDTETLRGAITQVDAILAVIDAAAEHDDRHKPSEPGIGVDFDNVVRIMAGDTPNGSTGT